MQRRVLIVDDDADIREVARAALEVATSWQVSSAPSGSECLRLAAAESFDVVLLDVMMPDMDGAAVLQQLRRAPGTAALPVVFLTAKSRPAEKERLRGLGAAGVLSKPFDPLQLAEQLSALLGWEREER